MTASVAPCKCRLIGPSDRVKLDSRECLLTPILSAFRGIQTAAESAQNGNDPTSHARGTTENARRVGTGTLKQRWANAQVAMEYLDRVLEEEKIPRSDLHCSLCSNSIVEGGMRTFHDACFERRFESVADLRPLKKRVQVALEPGNPAREFALSLPDDVPRVQFYGVAIAFIHLLRT